MRVLVDTDPGNGISGADIDDGLALGILLRSPETTVEAVTVVAGNVDVDTGTGVALTLLEVAEAGNIPVHRGAERPLVQDPSAWRAWLDRHRRDEPATQATASRTLASQRAAEAIVDAVMSAPGEVTVLAIGPLTNVATAIALEPAFVDNVARIVVMGGAFEVPSVLQELNFSYDPEAAHIVLTSRVPLTIVPLDVTLKTRMRLADVDRLATAGTPLARYLAQTTRPWVELLAAEQGLDGCFLHDPLAAAILINPSLVRTRRVHVDVELDGTLTRGRSIAWDSAKLWAAPGTPLPQTRPADVACDVDADRFLAFMLERLSA